MFIPVAVKAKLAPIGSAAAWTEWGVLHPKVWLGGPQCTWPHE